MNDKGLIPHRAESGPCLCCICIGVRFATVSAGDLMRYEAIGRRGGWRRVAAGCVRHSTRASAYRALRVLCSCSPSPSIPRRTVWPAFRNTGDGLIPIPTPGGVPVVITSPGCSVMQVDR